MSIFRNMKKGYWGVFKIRFITSLQYRAAALASLTTNTFWGIMLLMIFKAFYDARQPSTMSYDELVSYIWLNQAFLAIVMLWGRDRELGNIIISGDIAYELIRPYSIYKFWYFKVMSNMISSCVLRMPIILTIAALLPAPYNLSTYKWWCLHVVFIIHVIIRFTRSCYFNANVCIGI